MLTHIEIVNMQGQILVLPLQNVVDGFVVIDVDGLDPVKAEIVSSKFAQVDGEHYQTSRSGTRNIVLKIGLEAALYAAGTVQDLRNILYKYAMPKSRVTLRFRDSVMPTVEILGYVEDLSTKLFVKEPEATISVLCLKSPFIDPEVRTVTGTTTAVSVPTEVLYSGTEPSGVDVQLTFNKSITAFTIENVANQGAVALMEFGYNFNSGDVITISTTPGDKSISLTRAGVTSRILPALKPYSDWIRLEPGLNQFKVSVPGGLIPWVLTYTDKYGGL